MNKFEISIDFSYWAFTVKVDPKLQIFEKNLGKRKYLKKIEELQS